MEGDKIKIEKKKLGDKGIEGESEIMRVKRESIKEPSKNERGMEHHLSGDLADVTDIRALNASRIWLTEESKLKSIRH